LGVGDTGLSYYTSVMKLLLISMVLLLAGCQQLHQHIPGSSAATDSIGRLYGWTRHTDSAPFPKSYNFRLLNLRDTLWALHFEGNWFSTDGSHWTRSQLPNALGNMAFLDYAEYQGALYSVGHFEGNIERNSFQPVIRRSTDLRHWDTVAETSNLPHRFFYRLFVFHNRIWMMGGSDGQHVFGDTWSSSDAIHWKQEQAANDPGPREGSRFVVFHDSVYLFNNDVWRSADALHWTKIADAIVPGQQIFGYAAVVFDDRIWLLGCNRNGQFTSKVYCSKDGMHWESSDAPWSPRGGIAACVFKNAIYMTGGKYGGMPNAPEFIYSNDVWSMAKKDKP